MVKKRLGTDYQGDGIQDRIPEKEVRFTELCPSQKYEELRSNNLDRRTSKETKVNKKYD